MSNSHQNITFQTGIGVDATIQRTTVGKEQAAPANQTLAQLGLACHPAPTTATKYMGSAAVHIYYSEILQQLFFVSQCDGLALYGCGEAVASKGLTDLMGAVKKLYGRRHGKLRSGF